VFFHARRKFLLTHEFPSRIFYALFSFLARSLGLPR